MIKKTISYISVFLIPISLVVFALFFSDISYSTVILIVTVFSFIPFFMSFEKHANTTRIVLLSVMVALSVAGRSVFMFLPHFKPVCAFAIIAGMYLGAQTGFLCGALSALISNFIFGQGPWTPFQMFSWGLIGLISALIAKYLKSNKVVLSLYGILSAFLFSGIVDIWTTVWADGYFNFNRYLVLFVTALPVTITYAVSNVIFLLILTRVMGNALERVNLKYSLK